MNEQSAFIPHTKKWDLSLSEAPFPFTFSARHLWYPLTVCFPWPHHLPPSTVDSPLPLPHPQSLWTPVSTFRGHQSLPGISPHVNPLSSLAAYVTSHNKTWEETNHCDNLDTGQSQEECGMVKGHRMAELQAEQLEMGRGWTRWSPINTMKS